MAFDNLRIIRLQAENIKRLVAVEISPKGDVVTIAGKNGQGKTSVLDSILWAMAGGRSIQWMPIREGEAKATIRLELGNSDGLQLIVTRTFAKKEGEEVTTKLDVRTADGMKPNGEQGFLNAMVGALSFDPAAFVRADAREQIEILKGLIKAGDPEADFDAIALRRKKAFDARTETAREAKRLLDGAGSVAEDDLELEAMVETTALLDELSAIGERMVERADLERKQASEREEAEETDEEIATIEREIERMTQQLDKAKVALERLNARISLHSPIPDVPDATDVRRRISDIELENNAKAHRNAARSSMKGGIEKRALVEKLRLEIVACDEEVRDLIERADLPVNGLELGPDFVMLRGVPFNQASDAEQLRASMALGMAANPKLRVIRIRDGSLLDDDALKVIRDVAGDMDFQIWIEKVGDGGAEAFILENGMLKA